MIGALAYMYISTNHLRFHQSTSAWGLPATSHAPTLSRRLPSPTVAHMPHGGTLGSTGLGRSGRDQSVATEERPRAWRKGELIGKGTFGNVFMGLHQRTGKLFAIKQILTRATGVAEGGGDGAGGGGGGGGGERAAPVDDEAVLLREMEEEIKLMRALDHRNIVKYLGTERGRYHVYIFLEYVPGGSLAGMLEQFGSFPDHLLRIYMYQICAGMAYLHSKRIIHRDIKGANVLVTEHGVAKLADFGCSKQLSAMRTASFQDSLAIKGSVPWMAPEVIKQEGHGRSADVWSAGVTLVEMATAEHPWPQCTNNLAAMFFVASRSAEEPPPIPENLSDRARNFIHQCLKVNPQERFTAAELLETDFLRGAEREVASAGARALLARNGGGGGGGSSHSSRGGSSTGGAAGESGGAAVGGHRPGGLLGRDEGGSLRPEGQYPSPTAAHFPSGSGRGSPVDGEGTSTYAAQPSEWEKGMTRGYHGHCGGGSQNSSSRKKGGGVLVPRPRFTNVSDHAVSEHSASGPRR